MSEKKENVKEGILYLVFGVLTTLISFVVHAILHNAFGMNDTIAVIIAWIIAVTFAFVTNKMIVFKSKSVDAKTWIREALFFYACRLITLGIEELIFFIKGFAMPNDIDLIKILGFTITTWYIWKAVAVIIEIVANYFASKFLIFKKDK